MKRYALVPALAVLLSSALAFAQKPATSVVLAYGISNSGRGTLTANTLPDGNWGTVSWQKCPPVGACEPVPTRGYDRFLDSVDAEPGTVFEATASDGTQSVSARTGPYRGPVHLTRRPKIKGTLRVGSVVKALPGRWSGGWGTEKPNLQLQACITRFATRCKVLAATVYWQKCGVGTRLPQRYKGWWVKVVDNHVGKDAVYAGSSPAKPETLKPLKPSGNTAVRTVGRIKGGPASARPC